MTDVKISELASLDPVLQTDIVPVVSDPTGTPSTKSATVRAVLDSRILYSVVGADLSLTSGTAVQSALPTTGDVFTLTAGTMYEFEGMYSITKSGTTCTTALAFLLAGGATITSMRYQVLAQNAAVNTTGATLSGTVIDRIASTVVNATAAGEVIIKFKGILRMDVGGTVTPQVQFSAAPTSPVMKKDSYIKFTAIGTTNDTVGAVA